MRVVPLLILLVLAAGTAAASPPDPVPGERVRVTAPAFGLDKAVGALMESASDSIAFRRDGDTTRVAFLRRQVTRLDVSRGFHRRTLKGAGLGLLIGAGAGGLLGLTSSDPGFIGRSGAAVIGAGLLGGVGLVVGTVSGAVIHHETWSRVPPERMAAADH
jgi:hypothetical protein